MEGTGQLQVARTISERPEIYFWTMLLAYADVLAKWTPDAVRGSLSTRRVTDQKTSVDYKVQGHSLNALLKDDPIPCVKFPMSG